MNPATDAVPFVQLLDVIAENYDKEISAARKTWFFGQLKKYDFDIVVRAFDRYTQSASAKFGFPQPIHIIEIIEGSEEEREAHAWQLITDACRRVGNYASIIIEDPVLAATIERMWGTWAACCEEWGKSNNFTWAAKRKEFVPIYRMARRMVDPASGPQLLAGRTELDNRLRGMFPKRQPFGRILLDGRVDTRYLPIHETTGLPETTLSRALALPRERARLMLTDGTDVTETGNEPTPKPDPAKARRILRKLFDEWERKRAKMPTLSKPRQTKIRELTPEEDEARRALLREQARMIINAEAKEDLRSGPALRREEDAGGRRSDRDSDGGGTPAKTRARTSVRTRTG